MRLKKLKLNTDSQFQFIIRPICRCGNSNTLGFQLKIQQNKAVDGYSSHYLTIMSSLKCIFPREVTPGEV